MSGKIIKKLVAISTIGLGCGIIAGYWCGPVFGTGIMLIATGIIYIAETD